MNRLQIAFLTALAVAAFVGGLALFSARDTGPPMQEGAAADGGQGTTATSGNQAPDTDALAAQAAALGCAARSLLDGSYDVDVATEPDPPRVEGTLFRLHVTRDGEPVTDARVCLSIGMSEMSHEGVAAEAREVDPGRYELEVGFSMRGAWDGSIKVIEPGRPAVRVPFSTIVQ